MKITVVAKKVVFICQFWYALIPRYTYNILEIKFFIVYDPKNNTFFIIENNMVDRI